VLTLIKITCCNTWLQILELSFLCFSGVAIANNLSFSAPAIVCHHVGIPGSLVSFLHCFYVLVEAGPSPGFSSRRGQKPGEVKNQKGSTFLKYSIEWMQQPVGQRWNGGAPISNEGVVHHWPPRWRRTWVKGLSLFFHHASKFSEK